MVSALPWAVFHLKERKNSKRVLKLLSHKFPLEKAIHHEAVA